MEFTTEFIREFIMELELEFFDMEYEKPAAGGLRQISVGRVFGIAGL